jgi:hypothetical protein
MGVGLILVRCTFCIGSAVLVKMRVKKLNKKLEGMQGWSDHTGVERGWKHFY